MMNSRLRQVTLAAYARSRRPDQPPVEQLTDAMKIRIEDFAREVIDELASEMDRTNFAAAIGDVHIVIPGTKVGKRLRLLAGIEDCPVAPTA
jgi:hypothetical protein